MRPKRSPRGGTGGARENCKLAYRVSRLILPVKGYLVHWADAALLRIVARLTRLHKRWTEDMVLDGPFLMEGSLALDDAIMLKEHAEEVAARTLGRLGVRHV